MKEAQKKKGKEELFQEIIYDISVNCQSARKAIKGRMSSSTFYEIIDNDDQKAKQYARACEDRADEMFDDILDIAEDTSSDKKTVDMGNGVEVEKVDNEAIQRSRLRVDARKWQLSKMQPKKYGDKLDITTDGEKIKDTPITVQIDGKDIKLE